MSKDWSKDDKADIFFEGDKIPFGLNPGISNRQAGYQGSASQIRRSQSIRTDSMVQPQKTPITKPKVLVNTHNNTLSGAKSSGDVNRNDHNNYNNTRSNDNQYKSAQPLNSDSQHQHQQQRHGKQSPHIKMVEDTNFPPSGATGNRLERKATSNHLSEPKLKSGVSDRNYNSSNIYNNSQSRQGQQAPMRSQSEQIMHQYGKPPPKKPNVLESFGIKQPISTYNFYSDKGKENSTGIGNQSTKSRASNSKQNSDPSPPNRGKGGRPKKGSEVVDLSGEADSDDEDEVAVQEDEEEGEEGGYTNTTRRESSNSEVSGSRQKGSETSFKTLDAFQGQVPSGNDPKSYSENKLIALEFRLNSQFDLISLKSVFWDEIEYKSVGSLKCRADISAKFTTEDTSSGTQNLLTRLTNTAIDHTAERVDGFGSLGGRLTIYSTGVTFDIDDVDKMQSHVEGVADKFPIIQTEIMLNDIVSPMYFPVPSNSTDALLVLQLKPHCSLIKKGNWYRSGQSGSSIKNHYVTLVGLKDDISKIVSKVNKFSKLKFKFYSDIRVKVDEIFRNKIGADYFKLIEAVGLLRNTQKVGSVVTTEDYEQTQRITRNSAKNGSTIDMTGDESGRIRDDPTANEVYAVYPLQEDAVGSVTIRKGHLFRLRERQYLNDELIDFKIRHLLEESFPETKPRVHIFNSHFYIKLRDNGYSEVSKWTKNVELFQKDFLIVPINQSEHWSLVVIARPGLIENLDPAEFINASPKMSKGKKRLSNSNTSSSSSSGSRKSKRISPPATSSSSSSPPPTEPAEQVSSTQNTQNSEEAMDVEGIAIEDGSSQVTQEQTGVDTEADDGLNNTPATSDAEAEVGKSSDVDEGRDLPCFICLDSLGMHRMKVISRKLRDYLKSEWDARNPASKLNFNPAIETIPSIEVKAPQQPNGTDCGVYTIKFAEMILEQLPRTTKTVIKEGFSSYIHPKSIREDEIKDMRVDMRNTLKELNAHYLERVQKLKKDKEDLKSKRRLEKIASVTASNPSSDAIEEKVSDDHMMNDDELSDTSSTASSKVVPLSPVAKKLAGSAFKSTAIDGHDRGQFNDSELWPEAQTQTQIQTLSSQNSDVITVASDVENYIPARFEQIVNNDDEMPITRGFARTATALKASTNKKPAKQLLEYESDSVQPPLDDAVLTSQDSDGSITVDLFAGSGDEDISVSASGGVKKLRKSNKSAVAAVDDQNLNTPKEDLLVNYFKTNFEGQPTLMPTDEQSYIHSADI